MNRARAYRTVFACIGIAGGFSGIVGVTIWLTFPLGVLGLIITVAVALALLGIIMAEGEARR